VTLWAFLARTAAAALVLAASAAGSLGLFATALTLLFVLSGIGNGSTYRLPVLHTSRPELIRAGARHVRPIRRFVRRV
jgi:NNP family nitrate/nitrite transporter-like MFS transporter